MKLFTKLIIIFIFSIISIPSVLALDFDAEIQENCSDQSEEMCSSFLDKLNQQERTELREYLNSSECDIPQKDICLQMLDERKSNYSAESGDFLSIKFFYGDGCPHCKKEEPFLEKLEEKYPEIVVESYEVWYDMGNSTLMNEYVNKLGIEGRGVPLTIIGDKDYVIGFGGEESTGAEIEKLIRIELGIDLENKNTEEKISVPLLGEINPKQFSLPILSIVLGALDGFNPCAMWTLLFLISMLLGMKDRKRMWILGTAFIVTSAFVYFLFMTAWLNLFLNIGYIVFIRLLIGLVAIGAGVYNLYDYATNKEAACRVTNTKDRKQVFEKIKNIVKKESMILALVGIILLAISVNLVELICSAGLPAIFTQVLSVSDLPVWEYYFYLLLYIVFFMIDDLFIFFTAMVTLEVTGIQAKYTRASRLIGGILILIIGLLLIFKPEWLMFG